MDGHSSLYTFPGGSGAKDGVPPTHIHMGDKANSLCFPITLFLLVL